MRHGRTAGSRGAPASLALVLPFLLSGFRLFQFTQVCVYAIALLGLNLLTGYNGQISLGHGAFYALGAYTTAIMIDRWSVPYGWTIPAAGVVCLVVGFLFGLPALRLEGLYLALATFALALAVPQILKYFEHWTGGSQGIVLSKPRAPCGLPLIAGPVALLPHPGACCVVLVRPRREPAPEPAGPGDRGHPRQPHRRPGDGHRHRALQVADLRRQRRPTRGWPGAIGGLAVAFVAPDSLQRVPLDHVPGRHRDRRARLHLGRDLRRPVHPVRAELGPGHLQGRAVGDLRRLPHRVHVRHAGRDRRIPPAPRPPRAGEVGPLGPARRVRHTRKGDNMHKRRTRPRPGPGPRRSASWPRPRCAARRRASPPPRSRSATPTPTAARPPPTGRSARPSAPTSRRSTTRAASTAARSTSSRSTTATARPRRWRWCGSSSSRTRCCSSSRRSARRRTPPSTST